MTNEKLAILGGTPVIPKGMIPEDKYDSLFRAMVLTKEAEDAPFPESNPIYLHAFKNIFVHLLHSINSYCFSHIPDPILGTGRHSI